LINYTANPDHDEPTHHLFTCRVGWRYISLASTHLAIAYPPIRVFIWWVGF